MQEGIELTFLMPCLNEEKTIEESINMAKRFIEKNVVSAEILIVDNGSIDNSVEIAKKNGARVIHEQNKGYGYALRRGITETYGKYIIMGDCDTTYDFENSEQFLEKLRSGNDLVVGNRFKGGIEEGAMPISHKFGVKLLSYVAKRKFGVNVNDFHCGIRGINKEAISNLEFKTGGMEFATEMICSFSANGKKIVEIPTTLKKCKEIERKPHLRTVKDGIRHLKYILKEKNQKKY